MNRPRATIYLFAEWKNLSSRRIAYLDENLSKLLIRNAGSESDDYFSSRERKLFHPYFSTHFCCSNLLNAQEGAIRKMQSLTGSGNKGWGERGATAEACDSRD